MQTGNEDKYLLISNLLFVMPQNQCIYIIHLFNLHQFSSALFTLKL